MSNLILAIVLGGAFGFVLQRVGAADPQKIIGMLSLTDLHLMKAILGAIGLSSAVLFLGMSMGMIDAAHLSIKGMYAGVVVGGLLLGSGWAISGYCPGTGVVAMGAGRADALLFVVGGLVGAGIFTLVYPSLSSSWLFTGLNSGKATVASADSFAWLAIGLGLGLIALARLLPMQMFASSYAPEPQER